MMHVDLREHVLNRAARWFPTAVAHRIELREPGDAVTLAGPVRIRVAVHANNSTTTPAGALATSTAPMFDYTLRIPSGHTWSYALGELGEATRPLGVNHGVVVIIEPVLGIADPKPVVGTSTDVCCDAGTHDRPDFGTFFPVGCEPCSPHIQPTLPPVEQPIDIPVAPGGCVRPRYFDGMFLTREDLEAEQHYHLIKNRLQNRAAGAGVVWGLDIGMQDSSVCVKPGFAWDCCGRDLVVTSPYRVDIAALIRDPAAAGVLAQPGPHRMHLLLEHVECPDDPRPVHGDPCAPEVARCEMARTRETVRLRLVPPRDFDGKGPIDAFLEAVAGLPWDNRLEPVPPAEATVPFALDVVADTVQPMHFVPSTTESIEDRRTEREPLPFHFTATPNPGRAFAAESVVVLRRDDGTEEVVATVDASGNLAWQARSSMFPDRIGTARYIIRWRVGGLSAETRVEARWRQFEPSGDVRELVVVVHPTRLVGELEPVCNHEACAPEGDPTPLFPTDPPFIHPHPDRPGEAADGRVIDLAWRYAESFLHGSGPSPTEIDPRVQAALRDLLAAWCDSLLYRGPSCGAGPHGVVIGCARVEGGTIVGVDPWGGRRWSMQYGLVAHVATQLGILPPDVLLAKLGALACCVAGLPRLGPVGPRPGGLHPDLVIHPIRVRELALSALATMRPLLRPAAVDVAASLADHASVAPLVEGSPPWLSRLAGAGIATVGRLIGASPEELHERVLHGEHADELNTLLARAEATISTIARAVGESLTTTGAERRFVSRADLAGPGRAALEESITKRLADARVTLGAGAVRDAIASAARGERA